MKIFKKQNILIITFMIIISTILDINLVKAKGLTSYDINGVHISVKSTSSSVARDKAFIYGKRKAFNTLMEELVNSKDFRKLPKLSSSILNSYVLSFGIEDSKTTSTSFIGTLNYNFNAKKINKFLRSANVRFATVSNKPVLIVPVSKFGDKYMVGYGKDTTKLWQKSWKETITSNYGLVSFKYLDNSSVLPSSLNPKLLVRGDRRAILAIRRHFGLLDIAIVHITPSNKILKGNVLYIPLHNKRVNLNIDTKYKQSYDTSINKAKQVISNYWKKHNMRESYNSNSTIKIVSTIRQIKPWLRLKRYINSVGTNTKLTSLQIGNTTIFTTYPGGGKYLANLLHGYGYKMINKGSYWEVSLIKNSKSASIKKRKGKVYNVKKIDSAPVNKINLEKSNLPMAK